MIDVAHIEQLDAEIHSRMREPGRAERFERAASAAPNGPLRGLVFGVKDIFRVDGLPTTAGSTLPPEELAGPEAAAVSLLRSAGAAVGHCPLALGSQTVGSVIRPAAFCGVVGYKPSYGRISTAGMMRGDSTAGTWDP